MSSKLIRLTSTDSQCIFDSQYDDDIVLEPDSEIAVQSCTFKTAEMIEIGSNNNALTATVGDSVHVVYLTRETYSKKNIRDLLQNMQNKLNRTLRLANPKEFGLQYQIMINRDDKVAIDVRQDIEIGQPMYSMSSSATAALQNEVEYFNIDEPVSRNDPLVAKNDPNPLDISINHATAYGISPWTKGCGVHRFRIANMAAGAQNGLCMGLTKNIAALRDQVLAQADIECAIQITDRTSQYEVKESAAGAFTPSSVTLNQADQTTGPVGNDVLEIAMEAGVIKLRVHTNVAGGTTNELGQYSYDYTTNPDLFPFICLYRDELNIAVDSCNHNVDPYIQRGSFGGETHAHTGLSVIDFPNVVTPVLFKLHTNHERLSDILGFPTQNIYNITDTKVNAIGSSKTYAIVAANNYLIEMLNFPIESYDSFEDYNNTGSKRGRANIIACIPINDTSGVSSLGIIQYEPNTPHFISLSNKDKRLFRNIRARIVNDDYSAVDSFGMSTITLLLKNK